MTELSPYIVFKLKPNRQNSHQLLAEVFRLYSHQWKQSLALSRCSLAAGGCPVPAGTATSAREAPHRNLKRWTRYDTNSFYRQRLINAAVCHFLLVLFNSAFVLPSIFVILVKIWSLINQIHDETVKTHPSYWFAAHICLQRQGLGCAGAYPSYDSFFPGHKNPCTHLQ